MQLGKYFTREEFERSQTATRNNIRNSMGSEQIENAKALCAMLDIIRDHYKSPVVISSGYRSPRVNQLVGGSPTSSHTKGEAADFTVIGKTVREVFDDIRSGKIKGLDWDQIIEEGTWLHYGYRRTGINRKQNLKATFTRKGVTYSIVK